MAALAARVHEEIALILCTHGSGSSSMREIPRQHGFVAQQIASNLLPAQVVLGLRVKEIRTAACPLHSLAAFRRYLIFMCLQETPELPKTADRKSRMPSFCILS
jgi:hypothetical protein